MSLLSYDELCELVKGKVITAVAPWNINAASIDVHLGDHLLVEEEYDQQIKSILLAKRESPRFKRHDLYSSDYGLRPNEFVLGCTREQFNLPCDIAAKFVLKSSLARAGLNHALAGWCDPGWHGSVLTLELKNQLAYTTLVLSPGMPIGQMVFFKVAPVPDHASYAQRGHYNNDVTVTAAK